MSRMLCIVILVAVCSSVQSIGTSVSTNAGTIIGTKKEGYTKFMGIPYGWVNESNPFGLSVAHPKFEENFSATNESIVCPQSIGDASVGTIQCLTMNIFIPDTVTTVSLPVMVWIHGGAFIIGSNQGPDPVTLISKGVIGVTVNYRLGIYGFMCLDTPEVPGNQGLKDQTLALKWVKENIAAFGGDVNRITIIGESAGGMSVNLHLFSLNEKLFNQVIIESGAALSDWMIVESNNTIPLSLAKGLGVNSSNVQEALEYLSTVNPLTLVKLAVDLKITGVSVFDQPLTKPCVEKRFEGVENFITEHPMNVKSAKASDTPIIIGHNVQELGYLYYELPENLLDSVDIVKDVFKFEFNMGDKLDEAVDTVKHFYFGDEKISKNVVTELVYFGTDFIFGHPSQRMAEKLQESGGNVYRYVFSYRDARHGDELVYLFDLITLQDSTDLLVKSRMTTLWANFAKYGNPTPSSELQFIWSPITNTSQPYLDMNSNFTIGSRPEHARMAFWDIFYKQYGHYQKWYKNDTNTNATVSNGSKLENQLSVSLFFVLFFGSGYLLN